MEAPRACHSGVAAAAQTVGDAALTQQRGTADGIGIAVDARFDAAAGQRAEVGSTDKRTSLARRRHDGLGQRMLAVSLNRCRQLQDLLLWHVDTGHTGHDVLALRQCAGLVEQDASMVRIRSNAKRFRIRMPDCAASGARQ